MVARRILTRATFVTLIATLAAATALTGPSAAAWQPGSIEDQIAEADAALKAAQVQLADTYETFTAAEKQYQDLSAAVTAAQDKVTTTRAEADAAAIRERDARSGLDEFASASYRHGSAMFSARAYVGARSPSDLLDRASMLTILAGEYGDVMTTAQVAVEDKAEADRQAQAALDVVQKNRDAANSAKVTAEQAYNVAVAAENDASSDVTTLANRRAALAAQAAEAAQAEAPPAEEPAETPETGAPQAETPQAEAPQDEAPQNGGGSVTTAAGAVVLPAQGTLTSTYGTRWGTVHYGIDLANSIGTPILSAMAGTVIDSGPASGFGLWVRVQHAGGLITVYGHINESLVNVGQRVAAGEQIATMGNRGQSTGPHLHFEVHVDGRKIDPLPWLRCHGVNP